MEYPLAVSSVADLLGAGDAASTGVAVLSSFLLGPGVIYLLRICYILLADIAVLSNCLSGSAASDGAVGALGVAAYSVQTAVVLQVATCLVKASGNLA